MLKKNLFICVILVLSTSTLLLADVLHVPMHYSTLQQAIYSAPNNANAIIEIADGHICNEVVIVSNKSGLTIRGKYPCTTTPIIKGSSNYASIIKMVNCNNITIKNLTIQFHENTGVAYGIELWNSRNVNISDNTIENLSSSGWMIVGIFGDLKRVYIRNNKIINCNTMAIKGETGALSYGESDHTNNTLTGNYNNIEWSATASSYGVPRFWCNEIEGSPNGYGVLAYSYTAGYKNRVDLNQNEFINVKYPLKAQGNIKISTYDSDYTGCTDRFQVEQGIGIWGEILNWGLNNFYSCPDL